MNIKCEYCKNEFTTKTNMTHHQRTAKYCLKLQGKENKCKESCVCGYETYKIYNYKRHIRNCKQYKMPNNEEDEIWEKA